ncbi:MAG TPA: ABC transporter ATP-binding protein [Mycobacteriales bacterium]|nr:ABC transporter ATP-binding protein [Mycobacteriales bacterium]
MTLPIATGREQRRHVAAVLRPHRASLVWLSVAVVLSAAALVTSPLLVRHAVDAGVRGGSTREVDRAAAALAGLAVAGALLSWWRVRLAGVVAEGVLARLRSETADRVLRLSVGDLRGTTRGDVVTRLTGDIEVLSEALRLGVPRVVQAISLLVVSVTVLCVVSLPLAAVGLAGLTGVWVRARLLIRRTAPVYAAQRDGLGRAISMMSETVAGVRVIQASGRAGDRSATYRRINDEVTECHLAAMRLRNRFYPQLILVQAGSTLAVVVTGTLLANAGRATVGTVGAAVLAVVAVYRPVEDLADWLDEINSAGAAFGRVAGLLDLAPTLAEAVDPVSLPAEAALAVRDVRFSYADGEEVLRDVSLELAPGERLALVGATGADKSTLARLLARLDDPSAGCVTYGGVDLRDAAQADVRRRIVLTPQEGHLIDGTIAGNVRLAAPDASDAEVEEALARIGAIDWARGLPHGTATEVSSLGSRLSAGERQLVALARVALADPRVVILDEATSALDLGTELLVERALQRALAGRTVVVIAHRATTAARADRVAVLERGRLVEVGAHDDLVAAGGPYAILWDAWSRSAG